MLNRGQTIDLNKMKLIELYRVKWEFEKFHSKEGSYSFLGFDL